jgi:hypothetical protein
MAAWRTKAYALFGFKPGSYSSARGKVDLFADLVVLASRALAEGDDELVARIVHYVCWAASQSPTTWHPPLIWPFSCRCFGIQHCALKSGDGCPGSSFLRNGKL